MNHCLCLQNICEQVILSFRVRIQLRYRDFHVINYSLGWDHKVKLKCTQCSDTAIDLVKDRHEDDPRRKPEQITLSS